MDKNIEVNSKDAINIQEKLGIKENKNNEITLLKANNQKLNNENKSDKNSMSIEIKKDISEHNNTPVILEVKKI